MIIYIAGGAAQEPYYVPPSNVFILLHGNSGDGSTTFIDSGPQNLKPTVVGGIAQSATQAKFGESSIGPITGINPNYFYVESDISGRTNDKFTVEYFVYHVSSSAFSTSPRLIALEIYSSDHSIISNTVVETWNYSNTAKLELNTAAFGIEIPQVAFSSNVWTHVAIEYDLSSLKFYIGGSLVGSATYSGFEGGAFARLRVGNNNTADSNNAVVYIDEVRVVIGQVVYGGAYTPPSAPFLPA